MLVNIGNTHLSWSVSLDSDSTKGTLKTVDFTHLSHIPSAEYYVVASVVPEKNTLFPKDITHFMNAQTLEGILKFHPLFNISSVGADRLGNALGLQSLFKQSALCIDAGTCITLEYVDELGRFASGAILPGRALCRKAMNNHTAQLPLINFSKIPQEELPFNTHDAMRLGVDTGLIGSIRELINFFQKKNEQPLQIVFTGGDANFFYQALILSYPNNTHYIDNLTFKGLSLFEKNGSFNKMI